MRVTEFTDLCKIEVARTGHSDDIFNMVFYHILYPVHCENLIPDPDLDEDKIKNKTNKS